MATGTLGTTANNSLTSKLFAGALLPADVAAIALAIKDDQNNLHPIWPGAWSQSGMLSIPNRGVLKVLPGGNDTQVTNWPPEYIPCGHLLPVNGGGVSAKPDCSGSGVLSPTSGGANAGNAPGAGAAAPGTPPLGPGKTAGEGPATPKNGKCPSGYVYQNGKCLPLVSGQVAG